MSGPLSRPRRSVAVIGAGPVGLMIANLLGAAGVDLVVLEKNPGLIGLPRAIAYDSETLRLFDQIGLLAELNKGLVCDPKVVYLNGNGRRLMDMNPPRGKFGYSRIGTFYQPELERVLLDGLKRYPNVAVRFGVEVAALRETDEAVELTLNSDARREAIGTRFVVACDGGASPTRNALGIAMTGSTFTERWLVIDAKIRGHDVSDITFFCDPRRPVVRLPAVGDRVRFEFMQMPGESGEALLAEAKIRQLLAPYVDPARVEIERKVVYAFHARVADAWSRGRVFLAGDAAHMMPPFAGQGMNSGMRDAANLAWKLAAVVAGRAGPEILDSYERERAPSVRTMVNLSRRLGAVIMPTKAPVARLRDVLFRLVNLSAGLQAFIRRGGLLPDPEIGKSRLAPGKRDGVAGAMLPQPLADGAPLDGWIGAGRWCALGVGVDPERELTAPDLDRLRAMKAVFLRLDLPGGPGLRVEDPEFLAWARTRRVRAVLVRPDRFIAERIERGRPLQCLAAFASLRDASAPVPATLIAT